MPGAHQKPEGRKLTRYSLNSRFSNRIAEGDARLQRLASPWQLVWCHERCHKPDSEPIRQALVDVLWRTAGTGSFSSFKKAKAFDDWRVRVPAGEPYVLFTDGREVKPCMEAMAMKDPERRPMLIAVLCEQPRQFARIKDWAAELPGKGIRDRVHVISDLCHLEKLLLELPGTSAAMPRLDNTPCHSVPVTWSVPVVTMRYPEVSAAPACSPDGRFGFLAEKACEGVLTSPVAEVLSYVCPKGGSAEDLENLLRASSPVMYEE